MAGSLWKSMVKPFHLAGLLAFLPVLGMAAAPSPPPPPTSGEHVRATVELVDGSRLVGEPDGATLPLRLEFGQLEVPLRRITMLEPVDAGPMVTIHLANGDRISGSLEQDLLPLATLVGRVTPAVRQVRRVSYTTWREGDMPAGPPGLSFGGVNWQAWRTEFAIDGDRLVSLPKARNGFRYGHEGHGRGPLLVTNVGNPEWRNYSIEVDVCSPGIDPAFNPYALGPEFHEVALLFHLADARESQNERGNSLYSLGLHGDGSWELRAVYNSFCEQPVGWGNPREDADRELARGQGLAIDRERGNHLRLDVVGNRIRIWVDGRQIIDVVDGLMPKEIGGQRLDHGGVAFGGGFDSMIWIRNFSARSLPELEADGGIPAEPHVPITPAHQPGGPLDAIPPTAG
jgi:hypothetical protein